MKPKIILVLGLVVVIGVAVAIRVVKQSTPRHSARPSVERASVREEAVPVVVMQAVNPDPAPVEQARNISASAPAVTNSPQKIVVQSNQTPPQKEKLADPIARVALSLVGADADAEEYWLAAIYDPNLSEQEREDLMEDLNEEGLSNPKNPGPEDLPLILNRLAIIKDVAPYADPFMLEHLGEAYKDLTGLLAGRVPQ